jgi:hypothetical protein
LKDLALLKEQCLSLKAIGSFTPVKTMESIAGTPPASASPGAMESIAGTPTASAGPGEKAATSASPGEEAECSITPSAEDMKTAFCNNFNKAVL